MEAANTDKFRAMDRSMDRGGEGRTIGTPEGNSRGALCVACGRTDLPTEVRRRESTGDRSFFSAPGQRRRCRASGTRESRKLKQKKCRSLVFSASVRPEKIERGRRMALCSDADLERVLDVAMDRVLDTILCQIRVGDKSPN